MDEWPDYAGPIEFARKLAFERDARAHLMGRFDELVRASRRVVLAIPVHEAAKLPATAVEALTQMSSLLPDPEDNGSRAVPLQFSADRRQSIERGLVELRARVDDLLRWVRKEDGSQ